VAAVDASGVVSSVLSSYRQVLVEYQRRVTGDPAALNAASQRCGTQASTVTGKATEISQSAKELHADWDGDAYTAYATAAAKLAEDLNEHATKLADQAKRLATAAQFLHSARAAVDSVLAQFDQYGAQLTSQAKAADANAVGAFISAARQLGEQAVAAAKQVSGELSEALAQLFPAEGVGRLEHELGKWGTGALHWLNGEPLDGRKRPRTVPSWFGNSGWKKLTANGLEGTRAPKKADTPFGRPEPEGLKDKLTKSTEITYAKMQHEQDGLDPEYDGKITSQGWDAKASGHAELAALHGEVQGKQEWGVAEASAKGTAFAGGEVSGSAQLGAHGLGVHGDVFVGGKVEGEVAADVAGVGVGANGTLQYGLGAQLDGQAVYDAGHVKVNFKAGVALGLGAGVGAKIDIDLPKLGHTITEYGGAAVDAVGSTASQAADAVGHAWDDAANYVGSW
jgi:WXG100 family type VII secretion target